MLFWVVPQLLLPLSSWSTHARIQACMHPHACTHVCAQIHTTHTQTFVYTHAHMHTLLSPVARLQAQPLTSHPPRAQGSGKGRETTPSDQFLYDNRRCLDRTGHISSKHHPCAEQSRRQRLHWLRDPEGLRPPTEMPFLSCPSGKFSRQWGRGRGVGSQFP